jgi:hypothetical protein
MSEDETPANILESRRRSNHHGRHRKTYFVEFLYTLAHISRKVLYERGENVDIANRVLYLLRQQFLGI